jgi:acyl dehydratase
MPINPDAVGSRSEPAESSWSSKDGLLYAVGVGAGQDPLDAADLPFVTENSMNVDQRILPTMVVTLPDISGVLGSIGSFNPAMLVHGEERIVLHGELPASGRVSTVAEISAVWDKGKGAVVEITSTSTLVEGAGAVGEPLFEVVMSAFIRGEGGFGGERGPSGPHNVAPQQAPDLRVTVPTRAEQALLYRLSGDRNPLHSDPSFAEMAGFDRPILHGLCTYGFTGRVLLRELCEADPARFASMEGRFSSPVMPGEELTVEMWRTGDGEALFRTLASGDRVVIDAGRVTFAG